MPIKKTLCAFSSITFYLQFSASIDGIPLQSDTPVESDTQSFHRLEK